MTIQALIVRFRALPRWQQWGIGLAALLAVGLAALVIPGEGPSGAASGEVELALRLTISFGIVIALIYLSLWALRRFTNLSSRRGRLLRTVESLRLAPRQAVHLIQVGDRTFLIGATDGGLQTLAEVELEPGSASQPGAALPAAEALFSSVLRSEVVP
ncbi:MAG TPA: flagellar biosynthetic protein FliO [Anaerolineales bacterium]|nr:flagellar biosynthetic protein FliO [Anaerolineales bacterium]HRF47124.1 flagellar biosynthetic protein FliO [Anaerolineales bacterium]